MFTTRIPVFASAVSQAQVDVEPVSPEKAMELEPQAEDSILIAWHQEGRQGGDGGPEHEQRPAQPEPHPEPRRSARIKAMKAAAPPKVKTPAKSTGRKRVARRK